VFGAAPVGTAEEQHRAWEAHKAAERAARGKPGGGLLDDIPRNLPALTLTTKTAKRAARVGFDWPDADRVVTKVYEELDELAEARAEDDRDGMEAEIGDVLLAVSNLARHLDVDPEQALRGANRRFEQRLRYIETGLHAAGRDWCDADLDELEERWQQARRDIAAGRDPRNSG
jgi:MazG family protein